MQFKALSFLLLAQALAVLSRAQFFDIHRIRKLDMLNDDGLSLSEHIEAAEAEGHPALKQSRTQDVRMAILKDFNHVLPFKFGNSNEVYKLVPDTMLNEVAVMTTECRNCTGINPNKWEHPNIATGKNVLGEIDEITYFYLLHAFDVSIKGTFYKVPACIEHSPDPSICLMNFDVFGIRLAKPFFTANGDGYMGLGIGNSF